MTNDPRYTGPTRRHYAYAVVSPAEYAVLTAQAKKDGLSIADFTRRCINSYLLELGDDVPLLEEQADHRGNRTRPKGPKAKVAV